jgi:hypothetical protein
MMVLENYEEVLQEDRRLIERAVEEEVKVWLKDEIGEVALPMVP